MAPITPYIQDIPNDTHHAFGWEPYHTFHMAWAYTRTDKTSSDKFSCLTHSTLYQFITGHTFTREYTRQFFPQHTQEQIACQCSEPLQTIEHVLLHCPLYTTACCRHLTVSTDSAATLEVSHNYLKTQSTFNCCFNSSRRQKPAINCRWSGNWDKAQGFLFLWQSNPHCHIHITAT